MRKKTNKITINPYTTGTLNSPYGYMSIGDTIKVENGHKVINGKLEGISCKHEVAIHWITRSVKDE